MFERVTIGRSHCGLCETWAPVAYLPMKVKQGSLDLPVCEKCIRAAVKAADVLKTLRQVRAKPPKKARKGPQSSGKGAPLHPPPGAVSSLVPPSGDNA